MKYGEGEVGLGPPSEKWRGRAEFGGGGEGGGSGGRGGSEMVARLLLATYFHSPFFRRARLITKVERENIGPLRQLISRLTYGRSPPSISEIKIGP